MACQPGVWARLPPSRGRSADRPVADRDPRAAGPAAAAAAAAGAENRCCRLVAAVRMTWPFDCSVRWLWFSSARILLWRRAATSRSHDDLMTIRRFCAPSATQCRSHFGFSDLAGEICAGAGLVERRRKGASRGRSVDRDPAGRKTDRNGTRIGDLGQGLPDAGLAAAAGDAGNQRGYAWRCGCRGAARWGGGQAARSRGLQRPAAKAATRAAPAAEAGGFPLTRACGRGQPCSKRFELGTSRVGHETITVDWRSVCGNRNAV